MKARYIIIPISLIILMAATIFLWMRSSNQQIQYDLFEVRRGTVAKTISVSGSITSRQKLELGFLSPGIVKEVYVSVGDKVEAGDILIALDDTLLRRQAASAQANLAATLAILDKTKNSLRDVDRQVLNRTLEQSRVALVIAEDNWQDALRTRDLEINNATSTLHSAQVAYNNALNIYNAAQSTSSQSAEITRVALENAMIVLTNAQNNYYSIINLYNNGQATLFDLQQAQMSLNNASAAQKSAQANYNTALQQVSAGKINAKANLDAAAGQLEMSQNAYNTVLMSADIKVSNIQNAFISSQTAYDLALSRYNQAISPPHNADVNSSAASVTAARATLGIIQTQISQSRIKAPIDGIITAVNLCTGELSGLTGPAIVLETTDDLLIETNISEFDINQVKVGQDVQIQFDAIDNLITKGKIASINPAATVILGIINYKVTIVLEDSLPILKPSMTTDLEILTQKKENVIFVPRKILSKQDNKYTVDILTSGGKQEIVVDVGLIGDNEVEIISGLKENDQIILAEL